jgi:hypothetical protein
MNISRREFLWQGEPIDKIMPPDATLADHLYGDDAAVIIGWYCGHYVGAPKWKRGSDWVYEPDECGEEFETEEALWEWYFDECVMTECPHCHGELSQNYDHPQLVRVML